MKDLIYIVGSVYFFYYLINIAYDQFKGRTVKASSGQGFDSYQVESQDETAQNVEPQKYSNEKAAALEEKAEEIKKKE